jgi:lipoate-protein ligase B
MIRREALRPLAEAIVPCGIRDHGVTSLAEQLGETPDMALVKRRLRYHFADLFEVDVREVPSIPEWTIPLDDFK